MTHGPELEPDQESIPPSVVADEPQNALPELPEVGASTDVSPFEARASAATEDWLRQVETYEREVRAQPDEAKAALIHLEIGRIHEEHLGQVRAAADSYQRAFNLNPKEPTVLHACRRLFGIAGQWKMVAQMIQHEADATEDLEQKAMLLAEMGMVLEDRAGDTEGAIRAFRRALEHWSAEPLAISALERLHLFQHQYEELLRLYERALETEESPGRRLPILVSAAQLAEDRLDAPERAIKHYRDVLELDPSNGLALSALRRLTHRAGRWNEFVDALTRSHEHTQDPETASQFLVSAARTQDERLRQPDRALQSLLSALELTPNDLGVLQEIETLYERNRRYEDVAKVLRRQLNVSSEPRQRVPILYKLGGLLEDVLDNQDEALDCYREAVRLMATHVPARQALGRLYEKQEMWSDLAELFEMEIGLEEDDAGKVTKLFKLAELLDARLNDEKRATTVLRELISIRPDYQPARKYVEQLLQRREDWSELTRFYHEELELTEDTEQKIFLLGRIGIIAEEKADDLETAQQAYRRILELSPGHLNAIRTLARIATKREAWSEALQMFEQEAEATEDQQELVSIFYRAGVVTEERLQDVEGAMERYQKALALNPTYLPALRSLGRIFGRQGRWDDLAQMFERELEVTRSPEQQIALLFRLADVQIQHLKDDARAAPLLERVLELDPESQPALRGLAAIHERNQDGEKLVDVLLREAETRKDPKERAKSLLRVAELCEEKLDRSDRAAELFEDVIRTGYGVDTSLMALVRIYSAAEMWNHLSRALKAGYDHAADDASRAAILVRCAEVAADRLHNLDNAADYLEQALSYDRSNRAILAQLERVSMARRDWPRALSVMEQLAETEQDPRMFAARQIQIAKVKEQQLDPPQSGSENLRLALDRVPDHPVALRAMELAYLRAQNWDGLVALYQREAMVSPTARERATLYCKAGELAEEQLGDDEIAVTCFDAALAQVDDYVPALRGRRRVAERQEDPSTALQCIQAEGEATVEPERARDLLFEAGEVYQDRFKDIESAVSAFEGVLKRSPDHEPSFSRLEAIYLEEGRLAELVGLYRTRASAITDSEEQAKLLFDAGRVAEDELSDPDLAVQLYSQALDEDRMNAAALGRLAPLHFQRQEWDQALEVAPRTLAVTKEPEVKLSVLKGLGTIYQEHRVDLVKAVQSFQAALQIAPTDVDSLRRLTALYKEAQDWTSAVNVLIRLTEATPDARERVATLLQLGEIYEQGSSDLNNAILAYRTALEVDPANQVAILRLSDLYERKEDWPELAKITNAYVGTLPPDQKYKAAPLHLKVADVYEMRLRDDNRAIESLRRALEVKPDETRALERLAKLYAKVPDTHPQAIDAHRRLLRIHPFRVASYREMYWMFERRGEYDKAFVAAEILVFLRGPNQEEEDYYELHKSKVAPRAEGKLATREHGRWVVHPDERGPLRALFELISPELGKTWPGDLSPYELNPRTDRHGPRSDNLVRKLADELGTVLQAPPFDLWTSQKEGTSVALENEKPPALIVGAQFGRRLQEPDQRFLLSRELERLKGGHALVKMLTATELDALLWTVGSLVRPEVRSQADPAAMEAIQRRLGRSLSRLRKPLEDVATQLVATPLDLGRYRSALVHTANRAGLVMTNDVAVAVRNIAKRYPEIRPVWRDPAGAEETVGQIPEVRELLAFAVSEEYFAARTRLGFSIQT